jgi:citrate synthase
MKACICNLHSAHDSRGQTQCAADALHLWQVKVRQAKLCGFGHRVYKNFDPRSTIIRKVRPCACLLGGRCFAV